jgi:hypothetical protein
MMLNVIVALIVCVAFYEIYERSKVREKKKLESQKKEPLMASAVEIERRKQQDIFIQECAKRDYEVFASERMKPESTTRGILRHTSKHKSNVLLISLLKDKSNMQTYLNYFHSLGWFIKTEIRKDKKDSHDEILDVTIQSTPFENED